MSGHHHIYIYICFHNIFSFYQYYYTACWLDAVITVGSFERFLIMFYVFEYGPLYEPCSLQLNNASFILIPRTIISQRKCYRLKFLIIQCDHFLVAIKVIKSVHILQKSISQSSLLSGNARTNHGIYSPISSRFNTHSANMGKDRWSHCILASSFANGPCFDQNVEYKITYIDMHCTQNWKRIVNLSRIVISAFLDGPALRLSLSMLMPIFKDRV